MMIGGRGGGRGSGRSCSGRFEVKCRGRNFKAGQVCMGEGGENEEKAAVQPRSGQWPTLLSRRFCLPFSLSLSLSLSMWELMKKLSDYNSGAAFSSSLFDQHVPTSCEDEWAQLFVLLLRLLGISVASALPSSSEKRSIHPSCPTSSTSPSSFPSDIL